MAPIESMGKFPTEEDALAFIAEVKQATYRPNQEDNKFDQFARALLDFEAQKITPECLMLQLEDLFSGQQNLLRGLKVFCPESQLPPPATRISLRIRDQKFVDDQKELCYKYLNEVEERFRDNPRTYREFLQALIMYGNCTLHILPFCRKIVQLLFGHADLLHEFQSYFNDHGEKFRQEVGQHCKFAIDDRLDEIEVTLYNLKTSIALVEKALRRKKLSKMAKFVERKFVGIKLIGIKKTFPEKSYGDVIKALRRDPFRVLPIVLEELREKEKEVFMVRSSAVKFLDEIHVLQRKFSSKKRGRSD